MRRLVIYGLLLVALTGLTYSEVGHNLFTNFDDNEYLTANEVVQQGWSPEGLRWAFVGSHVANWHPLTWLSHMTDVEFFGLDPAAHHWANVGIHSLVTLLLFGLAWRCGAGALWSFWIAAIFALHPLHVESVAWASERKDTLSAFFGLISLHFYLSWGNDHRRRDRVLFHLALALGLMAKPMLVTWPAVFVLIDFWPLRRTPSWRSVVMEKSGAWALALASVVATIWAQGKGRALVAGTEIPFLDRITNALVQLPNYVLSWIAPRNLAAFYPHPALVDTLPGPTPLHLFASGLSLMAITAAGVLLWRRRQQPLPLLGWCFYLGTLVPVIGLLQAGPQSHADRYTYLPSIGLMVIGAALLRALAARQTWGRPLAWILVVGTVLLCIPATRSQVRVWHDSESLWRHALVVTDENWLAHNNLGNALSQQGRKAEARTHYAEAVRILPSYTMAHFNLGNTLIEAGEIDRGIEEYRAAIRYDRQNAAAMNNLGNELAKQGRFAEAVEWFESALRYAPQLGEARMNLGWSLLFLHRAEEARPHFEWLVQRRPQSARVHHGLAQALLFTGDRGAVDEARRAVDLSQGQNPEILETLARAQGASGAQEEAIETLERAATLFREQGQSADARRLEELLQRSRSPSGP